MLEKKVIDRAKEYSRRTTRLARKRREKYGFNPKKPKNFLREYKNNG